MFAAEFNFLKGQLHLFLPVVDQRHHPECALADSAKKLEAAGKISLEFFGRMHKRVVFALVFGVGLRHDCIIYSK